MRRTLRDMVVAVDEQGRVVGVGGLHIIWDRLAEIRTMAVAPDMTRQGIGAEIVRRLIEEGDALGVEKYFTLTYKPGFFQKLWKECIDCPKFPNCDEIAMVRV